MRATVSVFSLSTWTSLDVPLGKILPQVGKVERKTFPRSEAMAFEDELEKRNFELTLVVKEMQEQPVPRLVAYVGITRVKGKAFLHKVCVIEEFRCQGIATEILRQRIDILKCQGCDIVQLWVEEDRKPAKFLYNKLGFEVDQSVVDYYGPGRSGLRMVLRFVASPQLRNVLQDHPPPETLQHRSLGNH